MPSRVPLLVRERDLPALLGLMLADGMHFSDVTYGWETGDALLYLDPAKAPAQHPEGPPVDEVPEKKGVNPMQGKLFGKNV